MVSANSTGAGMCIDDKLSSVLQSYNTEDKGSFMLGDGRYLTNVYCHPKGVREREVDIVSGVVHVPDSDSKDGYMEFSQSSFFGSKSNIVVKKLN